MCVYVTPGISIHMFHDPFLLFLYLGTNCCQPLYFKCQLNAIFSNVTQSSLDLTLQKAFAVADAMGKAHVVRESTSKIGNATRKKKHVNREKLKH